MTIVWCFVINRFKLCVIKSYFSLANKLFLLTAEVKVDFFRVKIKTFPSRLQKCQPKFSSGHFPQIILMEKAYFSICTEKKKPNWKEIRKNKFLFYLWTNIGFSRRWIRRSTKFRLNFHLKEFVHVENRIKCLKEIFEMHDFINIYKLCVLQA